MNQEGNKNTANANALTIAEAANRMGVSQQFLRLALQQEKFPFGTAVKMENWRYYINLKRFERYMNGEDLTPVNREADENE